MTSCAARSSTDSGTWGAITLLREAGSRDFPRAEASLLASLSPYLAEGMRRAILHTALSGADAEDPTVGLIVLSDDNSIESANPAGQTWLDELGADDRLPVAIQAVAGRARAVFRRRSRRSTRSPAPGCGRRRAAGC